VLRISISFYVINYHYIYIYIMKCVKYNAVVYRLVLRISMSSYVINYHYIYTLK